MIGGPAVLAAQLRHLAKPAEQTNMEIRVLPLSAGAHASPEAPFRIFGLADTESDIARVESPASITCLEPPEIDRFEAAYDHLQTESLTPEKSVALLKATAKPLG